MDWDDLRYLLAVGRSGSIAGAARLLLVDASTVSRRLAALESAFGAQLLSRRPEGVTLTGPGAEAVAAAEHIEATLLEVQARIGSVDAQVQGTVRLSTTDTTAALLVRGLASLHQKHPSLRLEVQTSNAASDLSRGECEIAVRMFRETRGGLVTRKLTDVGWALYGSGSYFERHGRPCSPERLAGHALIGFEEGLSGTPGARWLSQHSEGGNLVFRSGSMRAIASAVASGLGLSVLPCFLAGIEPTLLRASPDVVAVTECFAVTTADNRRLARVRAVLDELAVFFERERALFAGSVTAA